MADGSSVAWLLPKVHLFHPDNQKPDRLLFNISLSPLCFDSTTATAYTLASRTLWRQNIPHIARFAPCIKAKVKWYTNYSWKSLFFWCQVRNVNLRCQALSPVFLSLLCALCSCFVLMLGALCFVLRAYAFCLSGFLVTAWQAQSTKHAHRADGLLTKSGWDRPS
jgi:hypothetical protein